MFQGRVGKAAGVVLFYSRWLARGSQAQQTLTCGVA